MNDSGSARSVGGDRHERPVAAGSASPSLRSTATREGAHDDDHEGELDPAEGGVNQEVRAALRAVELPEVRDPDGEDVFDGSEEGAIPRGQVANVVGLKFQEAGRIEEFDAGEVGYLRGERLVIETDRGAVVGTVAIAARRMPVNGALRRILRRAGADEERTAERNKRKEQEALSLCKQRVRERRLPMKVIRAELPLSGQKILLYFASEERIDFRDLVKDLGTRLHGRIEMRQVGARDEAKMVGGIGSCGRELCCSTFLPSFAPVSIKMAKDQGLVLNPSKVAGQCGRLKCCLVYEEDLYLEMRKTLPKVGKRVRTPAGDGKVVELDVLRQRVKVGFEEGGYEYFPGNVVQSLVVAPPEPSGAPPSLPPAAAE